ncbi:MAG: hypothetical protein H0Z19_05265 [Archaeoglobus sp.]|uniref:hypothetical protein n=1 Tax=Archaeoglobus sp. TaxID=1872626 RepID=UPI001D8F4638|nr:hypothetical protein [Archaeoglobus sp.]MBO8179877.1 hypothetical protein [Archaeoglobus sp.]
MALSASGNRGRYGVEQKTESSSSQAKPTRAEIKEARPSQPSTPSTPQAKPTRAEIPEARPSSSSSSSSRSSSSSSSRRHRSHKSTPQAKPTRAEIPEARPSEPVVSKEEQANQEFRQLIAQGKSPEEAASVIEQKYGGKVTLQEYRFEQEELVKPPRATEEEWKRIEEFRKGKMPFGAEDTIKELEKHGVELSPLEEQAIRLEEWSFQQRVRGEKAVDKTKPWSVERGKAAVEQLGLGLASGAAGMGLGLAIAGQKIIQNPIEGGKEVAEGTIDWFKGLTPRMRKAVHGSPFIAGQIVGEFAIAEVAGRATAKGAGLAKAGALKLAEPAGVAFRRVAEKSKIAVEVGKLKVQDVKWRVTEPLYQKGILRPKLELVEEKPLSQVLLEAAKTYKNIELGVSNLKGDIRPLSRSDIGLIEAKFADEKLKKLTPKQLAELKKLAEDLGWAEEIRLERQEWLKNTQIIDLSESGELAKIETQYRGKRSFRVESEVEAEKLPEKLWEKFEKEGLEFKEIGKIDLRRTEIKKMGEKGDLSRELRKRWEQREKEFAKLEKEGKTRITKGRQSQIQILKEEVKEEVKTEKIRQKEKLREELKDLKKLREEIKLANKFDVGSKVPVFFDTKSVFSSLEHVSKRVFFKQLNKLEMGIGQGIGQEFKLDTGELEKVAEGLKIKISTIGQIARLGEGQKFALNEAQKLRQLTKQEPKELIEIPKMELRPKFNIGREEKKSRRSKKSGRHRIKVKNPVLRFEDILAVEGKKYVRKIKGRIGGKSSRGKKRSGRTSKKKK